MPTKLEANASFRKPRLVFLVLALALVFGAVCVGGVGGVDVWEGERDMNWGSDYNSVYVFYIYDAGDLAQFAYMVNNNQRDFSGRTVVLMDDIDLNDIEWTPIGKSNSFRGTFDGNGHTVSNMMVVLERSDKVGGFFGSVNGGNVKNLILYDPVVVGATGGIDGYGCVVGILTGGKIEKCSVTAGDDTTTLLHEKNNTPIGGIVGEIRKSNSGVISPDDIQDYLVDCILIDVMVEDNGKKYVAPLVGNPYIEGTTSLVSSYVVTVYEMDINGNYPSSGSSMRIIADVGKTVSVGSNPNGFAVDTTKDNVLDGVVVSGGMLSLTVYYKIVPSYKITIPATLIIKTDTKTGTLPITATELWILDYGWVDVSVSSEHDFNLAYQGKQEGPFISYDLKFDDSIINDNSVAVTFKGGSSKPGPLDTPRTVSLTAELTGHPPYVGSYNDILTFTAEYKESAPANR